jgi:hypothetical protein
LKVKLFALVLTLSLSVLVVYMFGRGRFGDRTHKAPEYASLSWRVKQAKAKGERQLQMSSQIDYPSGFKDPDHAMGEALSRFAVVVAQPIDQNTYSDGYRLYTWYRFKVNEVLKPGPTPYCKRCMIPGDPPPDMITGAVNEILIPQLGGAKVIDDLYVVDISSKPYSLNTKYLLFLTWEPSKGTGAVAIGPAGVFTVDDEGFLESTTTEPNPLKKYILKHYGNSLEKLRRGIQEQLSAT